MTHRVFFSLQLPASQIGVYKQRHDELWPELRDAIREQGGHNYSIFALPDVDRVVGYLEVDDVDLWNSRSQSEITQRWWKSMTEVMPTNADFSPVECPILEVFHLD